MYGAASIKFDDPGEGNLDVRAYIAAVVGPLRITQGQVRVLNLPTDVPVSVLQNPKQVAYVSLSLPAATPGPTVVLVSQSGGGINSLSVTLTNTQGPMSGVSFAQVLLPGESLYVQTSPGAAALQVISSVNWFS